MKVVSVTNMNLQGYKLKVRECSNSLYPIY